MPVCRLVMGGGDRVVDKYIGLCGELLAPLFDLCRLSQKVRALGYHDELVQGELKNAEEAVSRWDPRVPEHFAIASTPNDLRVVETQARVYRAATLLIIHRLCCGFGTQDDEARQLSQTILDDIATIGFRPSPLDGQTADNGGVFDYRLSFPFFIAAVEVQDPEERIQTLELMRSVVCEEMYSEVSEGLRQALRFVWDARDWRCCTHWLDLVPSSMPPFVLF